MNVDPVAVAIRAWTRRTKRPEPRPSRELAVFDLPGELLVFDCESTTDHSQALTFGSWRHCSVVGNELVTLVEGLFYADDLPTTDPKGFEALRTYVAEHRSTTGAPLRLISRSEFVERVFFRLAYRTRATVVGFNLPFDLSRIATRAAEARGAHFGGFSLVLFNRPDGTENRHRPRIQLTHRSRHHTSISFAKRGQPDLVDLIPEGSLDGQPVEGYIWRGRFVDLATLAFSLTGENHTLASACEAFGADATKSTPAGHGRITEDYITYCRDDVAATAALYEALTNEYAKHPINLRLDRAVSTATVAKSYLADMGITPPLDANPNFPPQVLGWAMAAFYGGRSEARIRRLPVPVANVDFTSMYPTVDSLTRLWTYLTAESITADDATDDLRHLLETVTLDDCFDPALWPQLVGIAEIDVAPDGNLLPVRARYDDLADSWNTGVNPLTADIPMWYSFADLVASVITTGNIPTIRRALRFTPHGRQSGLRPVRLRGDVTIDPTTDDLFRQVIEARHRTPKDDPLHQFLKVFANSGSYGIHAEFHTKSLPSGEAVEVEVYGRFDEPFTHRVPRPEDPGKWCFPPLATTITGAARLMLAMLERTVTNLGGSWAFADTDSMAIVANIDGDLIACPGGAHQTADGTEAIQALTYAQVDEIRQRFQQLNPYDPDTVPNLLKREETGMAYVVSAKRYAIYDDTPEGIVLLKRSEHGLGHLMNPTPEGTDWITPAWTHTINLALGRPSSEPDWYDTPAVGKTHVTNPELHRAFNRFNIGKLYRDQVKPFNFAIFASGAKPPAGTDSRRFRLVAPFNRNPRQWLRLPWTNLTNPGPTYRLTTNWGSDPGAAFADTYRNHLQRHGTHPEAKSLGPDGKPCERHTIGLLQRRPIHLATITHLGKETNRLHEAETGAFDRAAALTTYGPGPGDLQLELLADAARIVGAAKIALTARISRRQVDRFIKREHRPQPDSRRRLALAVAQYTNGNDVSDAALWHAANPR